MRSPRFTVVISYEAPDRSWVEEIRNLFRSEAITVARREHAKVRPPSVRATVSVQDYRGAAVPWSENT